MSNQYLLIDGSDLTLIDTGMAASKGKILQYIQSLGFKPQNLKSILITHSDIDHVGSVNSLREISGAEVYASSIEASALKTGNPSREIKPKGLWVIVFKLFGFFTSKATVEVGNIIKDGDILPILEGLQVISSSGHTPGHLSFFLPKNQVLFAGDSIENHQGKPGPNLSALTGDKQEAQKSFEKLMKLNPRVIACGHAYFDFRGS
jgi:glyoxylase-like metal-dependent hydrolase (beta-lactamase superfamily II)